MDGGACRLTQVACAWFPHLKLNMMNIFQILFSISACTNTAWDRVTLEHVRSVGQLRGRCEALRRGGLRWRAARRSDGHRPAENRDVVVWERFFCFDQSGAAAAAGAAGGEGEAGGDGEEAAAVAVASTAEAALCVFHAGRSGRDWWIVLATS